EPAQLGLRAHRDPLVGRTQRESEEEDAGGAHGEPRTRRPQHRARDGLLQGNRLGELGFRRRPPNPYLSAVPQAARFTMRTLTRVPRPGSLAICHSPPMTLARCRMLARPNPC